MSKSWPLVPLKNIAKPTFRPVEVIAGTSYHTIGVRWWGKGAYKRDTIDGSETAAKTLNLIKEGDLVINKIWVRHGSVAIASKEVDNCTGSGEFPTFELDLTQILPRWLYWQTQTRRFWSECARLSQGTSGKNRIKPALFLTIKIPLPPVDKQRRIVARIEKLAAKVEQARALRRQSVAEVYALFLSVLGSAYYEATEIAGGTDRLDNLCHQITDGTHSTPIYVDNGVPFLSVKDITTGTIRFDRVRYIAPEQHAELIKRCKPEWGDVLLTKVGTTGFAKAIDVDREFSIFVSLALLKIDRARLDPKFTEYMLNSPRLKEYSAEGTRGVGNKNLVLKFIREFPMPAPSLSEQCRIVAYLDNLQVKVEAVKRHQAATAAQLEALLPSILDRAFRGEL